MSALVVKSETAYDALQDGLPLVLRLLAGPATIDALATGADRAQVEATLGRLQRAGIVKSEAGRWSAAASMVQQTRQEGMVTFLSRYVVPQLVRLAGAPDDGFVAQLELALPVDAQRALRGGPVQALLDALNDLSDEPGAERALGTLVVLGTSDVPRLADPAERLLETARRTARQRSSPSDRDRALLTQFDALFPVAALPRVRAAVSAAAARLGPVATASSATTYTLVLGLTFRDGLRGSP